MVIFLVGVTLWLHTNYMGQVRSLPLTQGKASLVDEDDYRWLSLHRWHFQSQGYATREALVEHKRKHLLMHREIMNCPDGMVVDHINGDRLDNRRINLRICTPAQNAANSRPRGRTKFRGVLYDDGRFYAQIRISERSRQLGHWGTAEEAARAHDSAAVQYALQFVRLNFPRDQAIPKTVDQIRLEARRAYKKVTPRGRSGFLGVSEVKPGRFQAACAPKGVAHALGWYESAESAAEAYDAASMFFYGEDAKLNFPERRIEPASPEQLRDRASLRPGASQYKGVALRKNGRWQVSIARNGKRHGLGAYPDDTIAALAYDAAALFFGDASTLLNFPNVSTTPMSPRQILREAPSFSRSSSGLRGVSRTPRGVYRVSMLIKGVDTNLGEYKTKEEAAMAYDRTALKVFGEKALLNFGGGY